MEFKDFCYWLQGYLELKDKKDPMSVKQINIIQQHLNLVLNKHPHMGLIGAVGPTVYGTTGAVYVYPLGLVPSCTPTGSTC